MTGREPEILSRVVPVANRPGSENGGRLIGFEVAMFSLIFTHNEQLCEEFFVGKTRNEMQHCLGLRLRSIPTGRQLIATGASGVLI